MNAWLWFTVICAVTFIMLALIGMRKAKTDPPPAFMSVKGTDPKRGCDCGNGQFDRTINYQPNPSLRPDPPPVGGKADDL